MDKNGSKKMYFAFQVVSWSNEQVVKSSSEDEAYSKTLAIARPEEIRNFREISRKEALKIKESWN